MTASLRLVDLWATYGSTRVLKGLSLDVPQGTLTALLGPSGCGKTTALKVIAGLVAPESGDVWLGETRLTELPAERRGLGVVFQKPLLFPHLTVAENVAFGLRMRRASASHVATEVAAALRMVHLHDLAHRRPRELSGGQEQRVALARALVTRPPVLLLDEPLTALDEHLRSQMRALVLEIQRQLSITTIFVTHDQREAAAVAQQVALVLDGRIAQCGPLRDFYTAPVTAAVGRFFGWCLVPRDAEGMLAADTETAGTVAAFHPSAASLRLPTRGRSNGLPGTVVRVVDRGHRARISVQLDAGPTIDLNHPLHEGTCPPTAGTSVEVAVPAGAVRILS